MTSHVIFAIVAALSGTLGSIITAFHNPRIKHPLKPTPPCPIDCWHFRR
jgi:hypothetical protein